MLEFWKNRKIRKGFRKMRSHLVHWRHNDDDILSDSQKSDFDRVLADAAEAAGEGPAAMASFCNTADARMARIIPPKRFRTVREWLDIIVVAMAVAFGIRGLFLQPFKIPTSSMQPTLYGIHYMDRENSSNPLLGKLPQPLEWLLFSTRPAQLTVQEEGEIDPSSVRRSGNLLFDSISFRIAGHEYTLPGELAKVRDYAQLEPYRTYHKGEKLSDGYLSTGDHLFVDRISPNLFGLKRGDVIVFNTANIASPNGQKLMDVSGFYYIKRLAGLPGDTLKIVDGQLMVRPAGDADFVPIQKLDGRFDKVYSMQGGYQGHTNVPGGGYGHLLASPDEELTVPKDHYFVLGDNTRYSADSRIWGLVPRKNITGKALFVFWPLSRRWGIADHAGALPVPTGKPVGNTFPSMGLQ